MVEYDILISEDPHDKDVVKVDERGGKVWLERAEEGGKRVDVIHVPEDIGVYDAIRDPPSYQPTSYIIATEGVPVTRRGRELKDRLRKRIDPSEYASHVLAVAWCFLHGDVRRCPSFIARKSFRARRKSGATVVKRAIPLYRVACDLLPKALFAKKHGELPSSRAEALRENRELAELCFRTYTSMLDGRDYGLDEVFLRLSELVNSVLSEKDFIAMERVFQRMGIDYAGQLHRKEA